MTLWEEVKNSRNFPNTLEFKSSLVFRATQFIYTFPATYLIQVDCEIFIAHNPCLKRKCMRVIVCRERYMIDTLRVQRDGSKR